MRSRAVSPAAGLKGGLGPLQCKWQLGGRWDGCVAPDPTSAPQAWGGILTLFSSVSALTGNSSLVEREKGLEQWSRTLAPSLFLHSSFPSLLDEHLLRTTAWEELFPASPGVV